MKRERETCLSASAEGRVGKDGSPSFPKRTHLQHFQFESKYYLRFGIQQQTSSESLIPVPDVWGCWDLELINSATCNFHSDVLSASSLDISYGLEAADNAGLNPNPSYVGFFQSSFFFFFFKCFFLFLFFLPFPTAISLFWCLFNKAKSPNMWHAVGALALPHGFPAGLPGQHPSCSPAFIEAQNIQLLLGTRLQVINVARSRKPRSAVLIFLPWQEKDGRRMKR